MLQAFYQNQESNIKYKTNGNREFPMYQKLYNINESISKFCNSVHRLIIKNIEKI